MAQGHERSSETKAQFRRKPSGARESSVPNSDKTAKVTRHIVLMQAFIVRAGEQSGSRFWVGTSNPYTLRCPAKPLRCCSGQAITELSLKSNFRCRVPCMRHLARPRLSARARRAQLDAALLLLGSRRHPALAAMFETKSAQLSDV